MVDGLTFAARTLSSTSQEGAALLLSGGAEDAAGGLYQGDPISISSALEPSIKLCRRPPLAGP
jgi:hypothetical protein